MRKVELSIFSIAFIFSGSDAMNQPVSSPREQKDVKYTVETTPRNAVFIQSKRYIRFEGVSSSSLFFGYGSSYNGLVFEKPLTLKAHMSKTEMTEILTDYYNAKVTVTEIETEQ